jgi:hypothetical protein
MPVDPVGNATPKTTERSTFPGIGLICHLNAGATSEKPESQHRVYLQNRLACLRAVQNRAHPRRHRVFAPSTNRPPSRALKFTPFSPCRSPAGTTMLEFVTSGRSVLIVSLLTGQSSAFAPIVLKQTRVIRNAKKAVRWTAFSTHCFAVSCGAGKYLVLQGSAETERVVGNRFRFRTGSASQWSDRSRIAEGSR